jgi:hypothetical protein
MLFTQEYQYMSYGNPLRRWIVTLIALLVVILGIFAAQGVKAQQEGKPIAIGDTVEGTIDPQNAQVLYALTAEAGNSVIITMRGGGGLDSYLFLKDASGETLAEDDDSAGGSDAQIKFTFTAAGTFTIVATSSGGRTSGAYTLKVEPGPGTQAATKSATQAGTAVALETTPLGATEAATVEGTTAPTAEATVAATVAAAEEGTTVPTSTPLPSRTPRPTATPVSTQEANAQATTEPTLRATRTPRPTLTRRPPSATPTPSPFVDAGPIEDGSTVKGTIDDTQIFWVYIYEGAMGDQLTITLEGEEGLVPSIVIASTAQDAQGPLKVSNARAGTSQVTMNVALPANGEYFVVATRVNQRQGTSSGQFTMTLAVTTLPAEVQTGADPVKIVKSLQADRLVPQGGKLLFRLQQGTYARDSKAPGQMIPVGNKLQAKDFVLQFQVKWTTAGEASGCGMTFRKSGTRDVTFVLLTNDRKIALVQRQGSRALINFFQDTDLFTPKQVATVTVIAIGDKVTVYLNGQFVTSEVGKAVRGSFEADLFNVEGNTTVTYCLFPSGWVWTFDQ